MAQFDVKKQRRELYLPPTRPVIVDVPEMTFVMVDGSGNPNDEHGQYRRAVQTLYALVYTVKMSARPGNRFTVPPLEGLWSFPAEQFDGVHVPKDDLVWTSLIAVPDFVTADVLERAAEQVAAKKSDVDTSRARIERWTEGLCVQMMHIGPYDAEPASVTRMHAFAEEEGFAVDLSDVRRHHEIYLGDPRRSRPETLRTVVRHPIRTA